MQISYAFLAMLFDPLMEQISSSVPTYPRRKPKRKTLYCFHGAGKGLRDDEKMKMKMTTEDR